MLSLERKFPSPELISKATTAIGKLNRDIESFSPEDADMISMFVDLLDEETADLIVATYENRLWLKDELYTHLRMKFCKAEDKNMLCANVCFLCERKTEH